MWALPYPLHYKGAFAFSSILYPLSPLAFLAVGFLRQLRRGSWGLPCFDCMTTGQRGFHLYSGGSFGTLLLAQQHQSPFHVPFGYGDSALLHRSSDNEVDNDSLLLILPTFSLFIRRLRLPASNLSCPACANFITYFRRGRSQ
jgi:hypothetical protein